MMYRISRNVHQETIFTNLATCSRRNFLSTNFLSRITDYILIWQSLPHWWRFIPLNISAIQRYLGLVNFCVAKFFTYTVCSCQLVVFNLPSLSRMKIVVLMYSNPEGSTTDIVRYSLPSYTSSSMMDTERIYSVEPVKVNAGIYRQSKHRKVLYLMAVIHLQSLTAHSPL